MVVLKYAFCVNSDISRHSCALNLRRELLEDICGISNSSKYIFKDVRGRPCISEKDIDFSVSHTENLAVAAVTTQYKLPDALKISTDETFICFDKDFSNIGVDVQIIDSSKAAIYKKISDKYFSQYEKKELSKAENDIEFSDIFTKLWTLKESICKFNGKGLSFLSSADTRFYNEKCFFNTLKIENNQSCYYLSVCCGNLQ